VNWGLVGIGMLIETNLNLVNLTLGSIPTAEYIVYILIGVSGLLAAYAHMAKKCTMGECSVKHD
ncbi:DUF378 domain-containing protein, partial [Patescibacteria group bacterium]